MFDSLRKVSSPLFSVFKVNWYGCSAWRRVSLLMNFPKSLWHGNGMFDWNRYTLQHQQCHDGLPCFWWPGTAMHVSLKWNNFPNRNKPPRKCGCQYEFVTFNTLNPKKQDRSRIKWPSKEYLCVLRNSFQNWQKSEDAVTFLWQWPELLLQLCLKSSLPRVCLLDWSANKYDIALTTANSIHYSKARFGLA